MDRRFLTSLWLTALLGLFSICFTSFSVAAQSDSEDQARAAFRLGRALYDKGDFLQAAEQFEEAYSISKKPELLYNVYVAYRDANMPREAADALRGYLTNADDIPNRAQLRARLEALERKAGDDEQRAQSQPTPATAQPSNPAPATTSPPVPRDAQAPQTPQTVAASEAPSPEQRAEPSESWSGRRTLTPFILMGVGGTLVLGSIITGISASFASSELKDKCPSKLDCNPDLKSTKSRGQALAVTTDILLFGGIATAGAGAVLFFLQGASESKTAGEPAPVALGCGPDGCYGSLKVAF